MKREPFLTLFDAIAVFFLFIVVVLILLTNYMPHTVLTGWDNLHPELNFSLNIKRSLTAVWQEYQGTGLLGGMAHASGLVHQLMLFVFSLFLPDTFLRYFWVFLMLFTGASGAYFFIRLITNASRLNAFFGSLFYIFNLATIQMFYVPFESFIAFYAALPWLLFASLFYLTHYSKNSFFLLITILFLATPAWYLQTLFLVFLITLTFFVIFFLKHHPSLYKRVLKLFILIVLINAFWLLPVAYFSITNSSVNLEAKINQMATDTVYLQNKAAGTLRDTMLLKGFFINTTDPDMEGRFRYMLSVWRDHLKNPLVVICGYLLFGIVFLGFLKLLKKRHWTTLSLVYLFIFSFIVLAIAFPPFSLINFLLREPLPLLNQLFRFPFTKFSTMASLIFAVLFAAGLPRAKFFLGKLLRINDPHLAMTYFLTVFLLFIIYMTPVFQGHFFYHKERVSIPPEYHRLFSFLQEQDPAGRIANFPQTTFWGWSFYQWGYGGSGFLWYGVEQPILDRAFDVWSKTSENYYFEVSRAVYSKDPKLLEAVLQKYQIRWVLLDKNILDPTSQTGTYIQELEAMLNGDFAKKEKSFGNLSLYKIALSDKPETFVFTTGALPTVNHYAWNDHDQAYLDQGNYISLPNGKWKMENETSYHYPFRSLFSLKSPTDREYAVRQTQSDIIFTAKLPPFSGEKTLYLPAFLHKETIMPVQIQTRKTDSHAPLVSITTLSPKIFINGIQKGGNENTEIFSFQAPRQLQEKYPLILRLNGISSYKLTNADAVAGITFLAANSSNSLTITDKNGMLLSQESFFSPLTKDSPLGKPSEITVNGTGYELVLDVALPKISDSYISFTPSLTRAEKLRNCDRFNGKKYTQEFSQDASSFTLTAISANACTAFFNSSLMHNQGYVVFLSAQNHKGKPLRFWIENHKKRFTLIDTYLEKDTKEAAFILPPMERYGQSYSFHFDNISIGRDETRNEIRSLAVYPVFYNFLQSLTLSSETTPAKQPMANSKQPLSVSHPNPSLYIITALQPEDSSPQTLVLSQSYDRGWKLYRIRNYESSIMNALQQAAPFLFGQEIKEHVMVNNWANGWIMDDAWKRESGREKIIILYLPQYLQYIGFLCLFGVVILMRRRFAFYY